MRGSAVELLNLTPARRRVAFATTLCAVLLALGNALPAAAATFGDANELGYILPGVASTDSERVDYVNHLIGMAPGATDTYLGQPFTRSSNDFGTLPAAVVGGALNGTGTLIDLSSGLYKYLYAKYDGASDGAWIWYVGNLSGFITVPGFHGAYGLSSWTLFSSAAPPPPDPAATGAAGTGFWLKKNGQGIIKAEASTGICPSGTWLRQFAPFQDLDAAATCRGVASYVSTVIKAASASGASLNRMLKAQMLATALDVYFSDAALGGNRLAAAGPLGGASIDLTRICHANRAGSCMVEEDATPAFGGANCLSVLEVVLYAAGQSDVGGTTWYGNVKASQELAKDSFEAISGQRAFAC